MSQFIEMFGGGANRIKLSSLCSTFVDGDWIESKDQSELGIRLIQTGNVGNGFFKDKKDKSRYISEETFDNLHCTEIYPGDILVSRLPDPIGRACIIPQGLGRTITAVDCTIIRLKDIILPDYFIAYTMTPSYAAQINEVTTGTTRRRISRANLGNILIPCSSIAKQQQFVAIAKQADKSKFGDFKSQFIEMFGTVESYCKLDDLVSDTFPGEWGCEPTSENAIKVIRTTNFTNEGHLDLADIVTRDIESKKVARKKLKQGDTILERSGGTKDNPVGRVVFFDEIGDYLPNNFTQVLRPKEFVNPVYLFYALYNSYNINKAAMRAMASQTTGIQNLSMSDFMAKSIVLPSRDEQNKFEQIYRQADKSKSVIQKALVYLNDIQSDELGKIA